MRSQVTADSVRALAKLERGLSQDSADVAAMVSSGRVEPARLAELLAAIVPELYRFPAVVPALLEARVSELIQPERGARTVRPTA